MKNVIITGANGFIGSWLVRKLQKENVNIVALVRKENNIKNIIGLSYYVCNFEEYSTVDLPNLEYDAFYHLAWEGVSTEKKNDYQLQKKNIDLAEAAINLAVRYKCKKFIGIGTVAEYVFCEDIMNFNQRQTPNDYYGAYKVAVHYILEVLARKMNMPFIWSVIPSTYGEGRVDGNIVTYTIKSLLNNEKPKYGDLEQLWDFLYAEDVAKALYLIGEYGISGKTYGIGSGRYLKLKEYISIIRDCINPQLELGIGLLPEMSNVTKSSCVGIYDLVKDTGFQPDYTFEEGIKRTIEFMKD